MMMMMMMMMMMIGEKTPVLYLYTKSPIIVLAHSVQPARVVLCHERRADWLD
jgi:hypothetical protein